MSDTDDDFAKAFEGFGEDDGAKAPQIEPIKEDEKDDKEPPKDTPAKETPPAAPEEKKPEEGGEAPKLPETPPAAEDNQEPETPQPLTKDDITSIIRELQTSERTSGKELENTTQEILEAYYPDGLSNTLIDEKSGKELRTPSDVVEASGGSMSIDEATQWLLNEQFKLDKQVDSIKNQAKEIAETTVNFRRDGIAVLQKYQPLFEALKEQYPKLQDNVFNKLMKQTKVDKDKGVILSAPDVIEFYDDMLEPYKELYEQKTQQPITAAPPAPPKPSAEDRMDISGDGGQAPINDPNDFAQQVTKELAKGV